MVFFFFLDHRSRNDRRDKYNIISTVEINLLRARNTSRSESRAVKTRFTVYTNYYKNRNRPRYIIVNNRRKSVARAQIFQRVRVWRRVSLNPEDKKKKNVYTTTAHMK